MTSIRIKGLVSFAQRVRQQLVAGIPADQAESFRDDIRKTIGQAEALCAAKRSLPRHLAPPSYRAYRFLKTLDLAQLPLRDSAHEAAIPSLRIRHLLQARDHIQAALNAITLAEPSARLDEQAEQITVAIASTVAKVEAIAREANSHVARLPLPSRQAYAWLKFLSEPNNLKLHLKALQCAYDVLGQIRKQKRYAGGPLSLTLEFYHTESEWRVHQKGNEIHAVFSEGFIGADSQVLDALVRMSFHARRKSLRQVVRGYSSGDDFAETIQAIQVAIAELDANVRGRYYDLQEVFDRVNMTYFEGRVAAPRLTWNRANTIRLMGYYQRATDTVMISISLDDERVPVWAIDHVMHHELLHRILGSQVVNGRLVAHTPEFRAAERTFREYEKANAFLNEWSNRLRRG